MKNLKNTIELLKEVIRDENCSRMNKSGVKGYLGELIVLQKLQYEGLKPEHFGNQSGIDIIVNNVKIDVKTSTLKDDENKNPIGDGLFFEKVRISNMM